jgi:hypothetical protein
VWCTVYKFYCLQLLPPPCADLFDAAKVLTNIAATLTAVALCAVAAHAVQYRRRSSSKWGFCDSDSGAVMGSGWTGLPSWCRCQEAHSLYFYLKNKLTLTDHNSFCATSSAANSEHRLGISPKKEVLISKIQYVYPTAASSKVGRLRPASVDL